MSQVLAAVEPQTSQQHGYDLIAQSLSDQGIDIFFALMGEDTAPVISAMVATHGVRQVVARHEAGAVLMADGYARLTGRVGVAIVSRGPGLTNALTALTAAKRSDTPLLLITGDKPTVPRPHMKDIEHDDVIAATGASSRRITEIADTPRVVAEAYARAAEGIPVVLNLPVNIIETVVETQPPRQALGPDGVTVLSGGAVADPVPPVDDGQIAAIIEMIAGSERPMILAGRGVAQSGAATAIELLAERIGAPLATSLLGKGLFGKHPLHVGISGGFATHRVVDLASETDLLLAFGARLPTFTTQDGELYQNARVVRVDRAAAPPQATIAIELFVHGDARAVAQALLAELPTAIDASRTQALREQLPTWSPESEITDQSTSDTVDGELLIAALDRLLPEDRTIVIDGGRFCSYACRTLTVRDPRDFIFTVNFGSMGLGMGTAIGATVADRNPLTVLVVGDGGFMMTLGEFETAVRYRLPLVVVVMNDECFGAEVFTLKRHGLPDHVARMPTPPLKNLAEGIGADGMTIRRLSDLDELKGRFDHLSRPLLIDCRINPDAEQENKFFDKLMDEAAEE